VHVSWWQVSADTVAGSRFVISPLAEATASLITLARGTAAYPAERDWLNAHKPAYEALLAADPVTAALERAGVGPRWIADLFTRPPTGAGDETFADELARIRAIPLDAALADLEIAVSGPLPEILRRPDLQERAVGLLRWAWERTVKPEWPHRRRILEADIVARTALLAKGGWSAALAGIGPGTRWLGEGRLRINAHESPPRDLAGAQLFFVPVTQRAGWVAWEEPRRYALMYQCSGALADGQAATGERGRVPVPQTLSALLGPARARVLVLLDSPKSTTQLVALTGLALGSVGRHIQVLHAAGLLGRSRAGRSVLYYRTSAGDSLVAAQAERGRRGARRADSRPA
jgi:DNA-binding transcriptional ArsR family regulator